MAPDARSERAEMSAGRKPCWGPSRVAAHCRVSVITAAVTATGPLGKYVVANGVWVGAA